MNQRIARLTCASCISRRSWHAPWPATGPRSMAHAQQKARQDEAHSDFGIDARSAIVGAIEPRNLGRQPALIKNMINSPQHMVILDHIPHRPDDEQFQMNSFPPTQHCSLSIADNRSDSDT